MAIHNESLLEAEICSDLARQGWLYTPPSDGVQSPDDVLYDRTRALFPPDLQAWLQATQPEAWEKLHAIHGNATLELILDRVRKTLDRQGTLHVLLHGVEMVGLRRPLELAQFRPAFALNPELQAKYAANRLRVIRQLHYSTHNQNCIDLVLFVNGLPVATVEIKTDYTQSIDDAVYQYRKDRSPVGPDRKPEPLLHFPGGALVHFALSNSEVRMTTKLAGLDTQFLPFNQGSEGPGVSGGAGNPPNPQGIATSYLWQEVFAPDNWLEILGRYLVPVKDRKEQLQGVIFPRFHQWDVTRKIVQDIHQKGPGSRYLIQHSAGSGKTHSIAWTAHFLADLHNQDQEKVFDSVIVISDRTVLDDQLQEALAAHQRHDGVVAYIIGKRKAKSQELEEALDVNKKIIVCTLQTFPALLSRIRELNEQVEATGGRPRRYAVLADEAHSSQTSQTATTLKVVLAHGLQGEVLEQEEEPDAEDVLDEQIAQVMAAKVAPLTTIAFTATPKDRTLQLFGTLPDPTQPRSENNLPRPFHVYSMRQAIEEGFILDVLQNYLPYKLAFQLAQKGKEEAAQKRIDEKAAKAAVMKWVQLHSYNISQHVQIVVEHFRKHVQPLLDGKAKAMVVTASRLEVTRWQKAMQAYIEEHGYDLRTLVAFSGEVIDPEDPTTLDKPLTETDPRMNPHLHGRTIQKAFAIPHGGQEADYALLLVANKFQTGFDEPLLCGMYVHKRLEGIAAVQTLSRLNRAYPGKDTTYILDFVNKPEEILAAFRTYYETAELSGVTDPEIIFDLRTKLDAQGWYTEADIDAVARLVYEGGKQSALDQVLVPIATRILQAYREAREERQRAAPNSEAEAQARDRMESLILFKKDLGNYVRLYGFLSQIFDYGNTAIEKRAVFFRLLQRLLTFDREIDSIDLSALQLTHHTLKKLQPVTMKLQKGEALHPTQTGGGQVRDPHKETLEAIIAAVNEIFVGEISPHDKLVYVNDVLKGKLLDCEILIQQAVNNTKEQFSHSPDLDRLILEAVIEALSSFTSMSKQALENEKIRQDLKEVLLGPAGLYEALRERGENRA
ncbi:type I restriction endonuclease [Candidatus Igneacidithiobacillus taiwanensis]|uniref:type I restriction endonuclease subunit R n=1 Tax=Candidatus Igneacidithiobacillus taiwanensis TaxID=1945924 RepID=UPI0028A1C622|nr:type I restriction endonuclease [Candidatus Igneacidithiobacillus taiwanensis]